MSVNADTDDKRRRVVEQIEAELANEQGHRFLGIVGFIRITLHHLRPYWKHSALVVLTLLPEVALETIQPLLLMTLIDDAITPGNGPLAALIILALFGLLLVYALGRLANLYLAARVGSGVLNDLRFRVFEHLQRLSFGFYARRPTGDLLSRFTSDLDAVELATVVELPFAISCSFTIVVGIVLMFGIDWRMALSIVVLLPTVYFGPQLFGRRTEHANYLRQQDVAKVVSTLEENIAGQSVVKAFGLEHVMLTRFRTELNHLYASTIRASLLNSLQGTMMDATGYLLLTVTIGIGAFVAVRGELSTGGLVAVFELVWFVVSSLQELAGIVPPLQRAAAGVQRVYELLDEKPEVADVKGAVPLPPFSREVVFQDVSFSYTGAEPQLHGVSLTIPAHQSVAIVGRSGSGKSTLLRLLMRFHDPTRGSILMDGYNLRQITQASLRSQIGAVFQDNIVFNATVRENIRLGRPDATDQEVETAAKAAEIHDFIMSLPSGYATPAGEKGQCLSGGERQRIALARALLRQPAILILDEPASALDSQTEAAINATLGKVAKDRTVISVTHRLASAANADRILVLEGGRLVEQGTHDALIALRGIYSRLWEQQSVHSLNHAFRAPVCS